MKPLVYYSRWQGAKLRLRGRDKTAVWGHLVTHAEDGQETEQPFHFNLQTNRITLDEAGEKRILMLDEMGVEVKDTA